MGYLPAGIAAVFGLLLLVVLVLIVLRRLRRASRAASRLQGDVRSATTSLRQGAEPIRERRAGEWRSARRV